MTSDVKKDYIIANNPMDPPHVDFTKMDLSMNGMENILVMMDAFPKFSVAVVTPDKQAKIVVKALVSR